MYQPAIRTSTADRTAILGFTWLPSDDGKSAIVEFVASNKNALQPIYADATLTVFEKGKDPKGNIEGFMQKYRKSFTLDSFGVVVR
jgi:hypothetical protein